MKRNRLLCGLLSLCMLTGCGAETANCSAVELCKRISECGIAFPEMVEVNADNFALRYQLEASAYQEYCVYWSGSAAYADEICVIRAADADAVETVQTAVQNRLDTQKETYQSYAPVQYDRLCGSEITVRGEYVFWVVSDDNAKAVSVFEAAFSD